MTAAGFAALACSSFSGPEDEPGGADAASDATGGSDATDVMAKDTGADGGDAIVDGACEPPTVPKAPADVRCADAGAGLFFCADFEESPTKLFELGDGVELTPSSYWSVHSPAAAGPNAIWVGTTYTVDFTPPTSRASILVAELELASTTNPTDANSDTTFAKLALGDCDVRVKFSPKVAALTMDSHCGPDVDGGGFYDWRKLTGSYPTDPAFRHVSVALDLCAHKARASYGTQPPAEIDLVARPIPAVPSISFGVAGPPATLGFDAIAIAAK